MSEQITSIIAAIEKAARGLRRNRPNYQSTVHVPACGWDIITTRNNRIETWTVHTDHQAGEAWYLLRRTVDGDVVEEFELRADHATVGNDGDRRRARRAASAIDALNEHFGWLSSPREFTDRIDGTAMSMTTR